VTASFCIKKVTIIVVIIIIIIIIIIIVVVVVIIIIITIICISRINDLQLDREGKCATPFDFSAPK